MAERAVRMAVPGGACRAHARCSEFGWRIHVRGGRQPPGDGAAHHLSQPRVGDRLVPVAVGAAAADHLRRQGRVPRQLEDQAPVPGPRHDPHRPLGRRLQPPGARRRRRGTRARASCSASTPRAPAVATASCTGATPARPGWRCARVPRWCRSVIVGTREIQPPGRSVPRLFRPCAIRIGRPIDVGHYRDRPDDHLVLRRAHRRADVRDPRAVGTGLRRRVRHPDARCAAVAADRPSWPAAATARRDDRIRGPVPNLGCPGQPLSEGSPATGSVTSATHGRDRDHAARRIDARRCRRAPRRPISRGHRLRAGEGGGDRRRQRRGA